MEYIHFWATLHEAYAMNPFLATMCIGFGVYGIALLALTALWFSWRRLSIMHERRTSTRQQISLRLDFVSLRGLTGEDDDQVFKQVGYKKALLGTVVFHSWVAMPALLQLVMAAHLINVRTYEVRPLECVPCTTAEKERISAVVYTCLTVLMYCLWTLLMVMVLLPPMRHFFMHRCVLKDATHVVIVEEDHEPHEDQDFIFDRIRRRFSGRRTTHLVQVHCDCGFVVRRWFRHMCVTYMWRGDEERFRPAVNATVFKREGLTTELAHHLQEEHRNAISVELPSMTNSLLIEYKSIVYVLLLFSVWQSLLQGLYHCAVVFTGILVMTGVRRALLLLTRQKAHAKDIGSVDEIVDVLRDGNWKTVPFSELVPRDVIRPRLGLLHCDSVILQGHGLVNESMLTGEPMPVQKTRFRVDDGVFDPLGKHKFNMLFAGSNLLQIDGDTVAVVTATGVMTAKGQLLRMVLFPSATRFKFTSDLPLCFLVFVTIGILHGIASGFSHGGGRTNYQYMGWAFTARFVNTVMRIAFAGFNPFLLQAISVGEVVGTSRLRMKGIKCLAPPRLPMAGKLHVAIFDKTGTITDDDMRLMYFRPGAADEFGSLVWLEEGVRGWFQAGHEPIWVAALATCHSLDWLHGRPVGSRLDQLLFTSSGWNYTGTFPESTNHMYSGPDGKAEVLRVLDFDQKRRTSGSLVKIQKGNGDPDRWMIFVKGSDTRIQKLCSVPADYKVVTRKAALEGFYVIGLAYKEIFEEEVYWYLSASRSDLEADVMFMGCLQFVNAVRPDSKQALDELTQGSVRCIMCTGDSVLTGIAVARDVGILKGKVLIAEASQGGLSWYHEDGEEVVDQVEVEDILESASHQVAMSGEAYNLLRRDDDRSEIIGKVAVFGRMNPDQKMQVVKEFQAMGAIVGMCGDGGNDCVALRAAHVGVALSETEASVVAPFSTGTKTIKAVVDIVKVGRACLQTNMSVYNIFVINGLTTLFTEFILWWCLHSHVAEMHLLSSYVILPLLFMWAVAACCHETDVLVPKRPSASIFGLEQLQGIVVPHMTFLIFTFVLLELCAADNTHIATDEMATSYNNYYLFRTYVRDSPFQSRFTFRLGDCTGSAIMFLVSSAHILGTSFLTCCDNEFRRPAYKSRQMISLTVIAMIGVFCLLFTGPNTLSCVFRINCKNSFTRHSNFVLDLLSLVTVLPLNGCFYSPAADVWMHPWNYTDKFPELKGAEPYEISDAGKPMCIPPKPFREDIDPGNEMTLTWKWIVALTIVALLFVHGVFFCCLQDRFRIILEGFRERFQSKYSSREVKFRRTWDAL